MIAFIKGVLKEKKPTVVLIETGGLGYEVHIPLSTYEALPEPGAGVELFTHFHVREDVQKLFGFLTETERDLFRIATSVSGIGPALGISILSGSTVEDFKSAITSENVAAISAIPGIGKKTAQRMIVELKDKVGALPGGFAPQADVGPVPETGLAADAVAALVSLGIKQAAAQAAVGKILKDAGDAELTVQEVIRAALKKA